MNIRAMTAADIPFAMQLKAQNHWNQLEADWRRQLELEPTGCFVAEMAERPVGTACACVFGDVAWINMVLVDQAQRGQGIGTALMVHIVQYLEGRGVATLRLDATALGKPVYEKLGFVGDFELTRYAGVFPPAPNPGDEAVLPMTAEDLPDVLAMDGAITRTKRARLLEHLFRATPEVMRKCARAGRLEGYCLCRRGSNAWQIGPVQGSVDAGASLLLDAAWRFTGERVYLDVPVANAHADHLVQALGLQVQRTFLRMTRGQRVSEDLQKSWTTFGPEKG